MPSLQEVLAALENIDSSIQEYLQESLPEMDPDERADMLSGFEIEGHAAAAVLATLGGAAAPVEDDVVADAGSTTTLLAAPITFEAAPTAAAPAATPAETPAVEEEHPVCGAASEQLVVTRAPHRARSRPAGASNGSFVRQAEQTKCKSNSSSMLVDVPVHRLLAGDKMLLSDTRNHGAIHAGSWAHLACNLRLREGGRYLLLGKNGCGKSTLLKSIASGEIEGWPTGVSTFLVDQQLTLELQKGVLDTVLDASPVAALEAEAAALEAMEMTDEVSQQLCVIYEEIEAFGGEDVKVQSYKAECILHGLGFESHMIDGSVSSLSGGWRMRVALACALFMSPRLLMLDEPTNHLDLAGIQWLTRYLVQDFRGTILCVSHDRAFIDAVASDVMIFNNFRLDYFAGTLSQFEEKAAEAKLGLERQVDALEKKKEHVQKNIENMKKQASGNKGDQKKSDQVASRQKKLGRMGLEKVDGKRFNCQKHGIRAGAANENDGGWSNGKMSAAPLVQRGDPSVRFTFTEAAPLGVSEHMTVMEFRKLHFRYPGCEEHIFSNVSLSFTARCRVAVMGRNGAGKTTFVNLLTDQIKATSGELWKHHNLKIGLYSQHHTEVLETNPECTPLQHLQECYPEMKEQDIRALLGSFGLQGKLALQPFGTLSGGQRVRVVFAKLAVEKPHVLILDEPTNHLDIYSIDALQEALETFAGGVIVISHNQALLAALDCQVYIVSKKEKTVKAYDGNVDAYLAKQFKK